MGIFPKYVKPSAKLCRTMIASAVALFALNSFADTGQAAVLRRDYGAAAAQFMYKAQRNDPIAQNNLGVLYLQGRGVPQDYGKARSWFETAAASGLAGAMFNLGITYLRGYGVETDLERSTDWFQKGADAGDKEAQFYYGLHLYHGRGVVQDSVAAAEWFGRASEQNLGSAQYNLAMMELRGELGEPNESAALELLHKAAALGHEAADMAIGRIHLEHLEDPEQTVLATQIFQRLAEDGNADAQVTLGMIYTFGQGNVDQDYDEGRFWLKLASNQRSGPARLNLGNIYAQGIGVERDLVRAYAWYSLSAEIGDEAAQSYRDTLGKQLSKPELESAQKLAVEFANTIPSPKVLPP